MSITVSWIAVEPVAIALNIYNTTSVFAVKFLLLNTVFKMRQPTMMPAQEVKYDTPM
jgi:hypothetical protein